MHINKKKKLAASLSIFSNILLTSLKIIAGIISGSISIISEAIHSLSDFLASVLTFFSILKSSQPADDDHPYGHGKYEDMAGFIEGGLILIAALYIIYESVRKIIFEQQMEAENNIGIAVMITAVIMNILVSYFLFKVAKEANSVALYADGEHLRTDVYSSFGVLAGLVLIKITGYSVLDPVIAMIVAAFIFRAGYVISKESLMNLLDHSLPNEDIQKIEKIAKKFSDKVTLKEHSIKARRVGPTKDIDMILQFPENISICECHKICDEIEKEISEIFLNCSISIHSEPICYKKNCQKFCNKF